MEFLSLEAEAEELFKTNRFVDAVSTTPENRPESQTRHHALICSWTLPLTGKVINGWNLTVSLRPLNT